MNKLDLDALDSRTCLVIQKILRHQKKLRKLDKQMAAFLCVDCKYQTLWDEYYALTRDVWAATGIPENGGMLCIGCVEKRLGRELRVWDFDPKASVNWCVRDTPVARKSTRLLDRLGVSEKLWKRILEIGGTLKYVGDKWMYSGPT